MKTTEFNKMQIEQEKEFRAKIAQKRLDKENEEKEAIRLEKAEAEAETLKQKNIKIKPFGKFLYKQTQISDAIPGPRQLSSLKKHDIACDVEEQAINQFQLLMPNTTQMQYNYNCIGGGDLNYDNTMNKYTDEKTYSKSYDALHSHNIECDNNSVLSKVELKYDYDNIEGATYSNYYYKCVPSDSKLTCRKDSTTEQTFNPNNLSSLPLHNIKCKDDEALSQFKFVSNTPDTAYYEYTCCK